MNTKEAQIEQAIQDAGCTAPRLTPAHIDEQIVAQHFYQFPNTTTIVCCLVLKNGFTVVGHSACVSEANFRNEIGGQIAFDNARAKIWELEGYLLCQQSL